jgi:hypothetical protein
MESRGASSSPSPALILVGDGGRTGRGNARADTGGHAPLREGGTGEGCQRESLPAVSIAARPASRRATGMRKGEQDT